MPTIFKNILERTTRRYQTTIKDEDGAVVPAANLSTLKLTLFSLHSGAILNSRSAQNVLNQNNVTVDTQGLLRWTLQPADNAILDDTLNIEVHRALFEWNYQGGKEGKHEVDFYVTNLRKVT